MKSGNDQMEAIEQMLKGEKSEDLLKQSFGIFLKFDRGNIFSRIIIILISICFSVRISIIETVVVMRDISSVMLDVAIAVFGVLFTGYTLFQAVLNKELIFIFMQDIKKDAKKKESKSTLHITNWNFVQLMFQFAIMIFVNLLLKISLTIIPDNFYIFNLEILNVILASILLFIYFYQAMVILWRLISFLYNIYQLFNTYAVSEYLSSISNNEK